MTTRRQFIAAVAALPLMPVAARAQAFEVIIADMTFTPATIRAAPGDVIVFRNEGRRPHTATADDGSFDTGRIQPGEAREVTVQNATGFVCRFHPRMTGTVQV